MNIDLPPILWRQLGAALAMLENAIVACPDELWGDDTQSPQFWHLIYHTLFFLDLYFSESLEGFAPPSPFSLSELDPSGVLPERVYTKDELRDYLEHGRQKSRELLRNLTEETAGEHRDFQWVKGPVIDFILYTLRHVQHHTAQLNLLLRQHTDSAPGWVALGPAD